MKIGAENRTKVIVAAVLGALALILVVRMMFPSLPSEPEATGVVPSVPAQPQVRPALRGRPGGHRAAGPPHSIDPSLRYDWLKASEDTKYEGNGRNIFMAQAEIPQPVASAKEKEEEAKGPPPPPPPPPINLKFYGYASRPGQPKKIFLSQGEDVFIASEGDIVDRRYKVLHISTTSVEIEDVLSNNRQMIPLTQS